MHKEYVAIDDKVIVIGEDGIEYITDYQDDIEDILVKENTIAKIKNSIKNLEKRMKDYFHPSNKGKEKLLDSLLLSIGIFICAYAPDSIKSINVVEILRVSFMVVGTYLEPFIFLDYVGIKSDIKKYDIMTYQRAYLKDTLSSETEELKLMYETEYTQENMKKDNGKIKKIERDRKKYEELKNKLLLCCQYSTNKDRYKRLERKELLEDTLAKNFNEEDTEFIQSLAKKDIEFEQAIKDSKKYTYNSNIDVL